MTNSEAKEVFKKLDYNCARCMRELSPICDEAKNIAISALEENAKLKAEIERIKNESHRRSDMFLQEIEQLKEELEKSVKLPCKVGDALFGYCSAFGQILEYSLDSVIVEEIETIYCISAWSRRIGEYPTECLDELEIQYSDFGKTIFLTREEAEQSLKGKV